MGLSKSSAFNLGGLAPSRWLNGLNFPSHRSVLHPARRRWPGIPYLPQANHSASKRTDQSTTVKLYRGLLILADPHFCTVAPRQQSTPGLSVVHIYPRTPHTPNVVEDWQRLQMDWPGPIVQSDRLSSACTNTKQTSKPIFPAPRASPA